MDFYLGVLQFIGIHTLLGLSAYVLLLTGQVSLAQVGFYAIGAYVSGLLTVLYSFHILPALLIGAVVAAIFAFLVGFPTLRVKGLMLVVATLAFTQFVSLFFFNLRFQREIEGFLYGPDGPQGFREIRYFNANGWSLAEVTMFIWAFVIIIMIALWWLDRARAGAVLRAVGEDELAAQSVGINLTAVKVSAMTAGGFIAGLAGGLFAHYVTHIQHTTFDVVLATFAVAYPILGGLSSVFGTLLAVIFIQGGIIEGLRFTGEWRLFLFGLLLIVTMNLKPDGLLDTRSMHLLRGLFRFSSRDKRQDKGVVRA
ncbi:MAG: branched-chain amino acid ABC transporter permease [Chloroflexota bacterium]